MGILRQIWITVAIVAAVFFGSWLAYMPGADQRGLWRSADGLTVLELTRIRGTLYSDAGAGCIEQARFPAHLLALDWLRNIWLDTDDDQLLLHNGHLLEAMVFTRSTGCDTPTDFDLIQTLRRVLAPHYELPANIMADADQQTQIAALLDGHDDPNLRLFTPIGVFPTPDPNAQTQRATQIAATQQVIGTPLHHIDQTGLAYATLPDGRGYVLILDLAITPPFATRPGPAMASAFDVIATALSDAPALILDLRFASSGSQTGAFGIAGHFTADMQPVFTAHSPASDLPPFAASLLPFDDSPLTQPVYLLTSPATAHAAELLILALRDLPQVTLIGSPTAGAPGQPQALTLPDGATLTYSHQTITDPNGVQITGRGIPADLPLSGDTRTADALRAALDMAQ